MEPAERPGQLLPSALGNSYGVPWLTLTVPSQPFFQDHLRAPACTPCEPVRKEGGEGKGNDRCGVQWLRGIVGGRVCGMWGSGPAGGHWLGGPVGCSASGPHGQASVVSLKFLVSACFSRI